MNIVYPFCFSRLAAAVALFSCSVAAMGDEVAANAAPTNDVVTLAGGLGTTAIQHLRDDDVKSALEVLGKAADVSYPANNRYEDVLGPAAGALSRALTQLSADEQYDLLYKWTMPTDDRKSVRILTSLVPEIAPPEEFARALGERPKKESFAISSVGPMPGLFCSAWTMIVAADDAGSLRKLITELEGLSSNKTANADFVLQLAKLRDSRSDVEDLKKFLNSRIEGGAGVPSPTERSDAVLVAAAMRRDDLGETCEQLVNHLNEFKLEDGTCSFIGFLRRLRAHVILKNRSPDTDPRELFYTTPALWVAADSQRHSRATTGADEAVWLTHEEHVKRLAGPGDDLLLFRYPLMGSFELKGEVANLENGLGGMCYGALGFHATPKDFTVQELHKPTNVSRVWPFVAPLEYRMFNRINIRCDGEKVTFLSNLHPGWNGSVSSCSTCPWLGLRATGQGRPVFRNLELVGEPIIPREVRLDGDELRGWTSNRSTIDAFLEPFPNQPQPPAIAEVTEVVPDWSFNGEAITGRSDLNADGVAPGHLTYMRPCFDGETITYEFLYEADKTNVSPCIGRVAFLMEPDGVRLRWLTDGQNEWSGLTDDNSIIEPLSRRGPRQLPFKDGEWNVVTVKLADGAASLLLNAEEIYVRSLEGVRGRHFGLYHDRHKSGVQVRNVVLTGNWPEKLSEDQLGNLVAFD